MIYYIADTHFGHKNVIRFDNRPFVDTGLMDEVLIRNWNERITEDDKKADETSTKIDLCLVTSKVEYAPPFDVNASFAEAFEAYMENAGA